MACWLAVLGCAACSNEADFVKTEADNNSIVLDISSATTPVTRAGATGAEVTVSYVDVLIFDDTDNKSLAHNWLENCFSIFRITNVITVDT
jgi:hypothetical protein